MELQKGFTYLLAALILGVPGFTWAQAQEETPSTRSTEVTEEQSTPVDSSATKGVEKITVTGSHIKRIQVEGPSPVQILDREDLERTGYNSVSDVLREVTASSFGSSRERSGSATSATATVDLRGLGPTRTLVLLNGRRLPKDSIGASVDLNNVPFDAVESIEILKDGASALYGSDAIGGVVNIITKKDFTGFAVSTNGTFGEEDMSERFAAGSRLNGSVTYGFGNDKVDMVTVLNYRKNEKLFSRERKYTGVGESTIGDIPSSSNDGGTTWVPDGSCPPERIKNGFCTFNYAQFSTELPDLEQYSLFTDASIHVTPVTDIIVRASVTHKKAAYVYAPAPGVFDVGGTLVRYRVMELGNRETEFETNGAFALLGFKTEMFSDWEAQADVTYNIVDRMEESNGFALKQEFSDLIANGDFVPNNPSGSRIVNPTAFNAALTSPFQESVSQLLTVNTLITGELTDSVGLAFGASYLQDKFEVKVDDQTAAGNVFSSGAAQNSKGDRNVFSLFSEASYLPKDNVELQLAVRYDNYDDFGDTINPKFAVRYQPTSKVMLRSSVGTGFKAPDLQDLYGNGSFGYPTFIDRFYCNQSGGNDPSADECGPSQYFVQSPTNKKLNEEKFISANTGVLYQYAKNHSAGIDVFFLEMDNIVDVDYEAITQAELQGQDLSKYGITTSRDGSGRLDDTNGLFSPLLNLGKKRQIGLDLSLGNKFHIDSVAILEFNTSVSYLLNYEEEKFPGLGLEDTLGEADQPKWKGNLVVNFMPYNSPVSASITARVIDEHECAVKEECKRDVYDEYDVQAVYKAKFGSLSLGVQNVLGTTPPLDKSDINNQLNGELYNTRGRTFYVGYKATF